MRFHYHFSWTVPLENPLSGEISSAHCSLDSAAFNVDPDMGQPVTMLHNDHRGIRVRQDPAHFTNSSKPSLTVIEWRRPPAGRTCNLLRWRGH